MEAKEVSSIANAALSAAIADILRATPGLRAADIAKKLAEDGKPTARETVNKALYHGPFDPVKVDGKAAPTWNLRPAAAVPTAPGHFRFEIGGLGAFTLADRLSEAEVGPVLALLATLVPADAAKLVRHDDTAGGKMVARLAPEHGFAVEAFGPAR